MATQRHTFADGLCVLGLAAGLSIGLASAGGCEEQSKGPNPSPGFVYEGVDQDVATVGAEPIATSAPDTGTDGLLDAPDTTQSPADDEPEAVQSSAADDDAAAAETAGATSLDQQ